MKVGLGSILPLCALFAGITLSAAPAAMAQDQPGNVHGPSKYLYLSNATIKPGLFAQFERLESGEAQALHEANAPGHHIGMASITGNDHAIFFAGYDSFAEMQKDHEETFSNAKLAEALRSGDEAEAAMVSQSTGSIYVYRKDLSLNAPVDISQMRFFDITLYRIRRGHHQDFARLAKLYMKAFASNPDIHWATFEKMYGVGSDSIFIVVAPLKSLSGVDAEVAASDKLPSSVGADQIQVLRDLGASTIESSESDLFAVIPQISYVPEAWVTAQPNFWGKK